MTTMVHNAPKLNSPTIGAKPPPPLPKTKATVETPAPIPPPSRPRSLALPISSIDESPSNPRKRFPDEDELRELGATIRDHGLLQPVLVRPKGERFELVFGACRFRASKLVGLTSIEATCRELTDAQVLEIQVIENNQRKGVHPLEEAEGYEQLREKHGYSADVIAEKIGRSREYVFSRIKLLSLSPKSRDSFYDGKLSASNALYVARLPTPALQEEAIREIDGMSARDAAQLVRNRYMLKMVDATFDTKDATLLPPAGACSDCPKRTKNAKEVFGDVKWQDLCTDPGCFKAKREASADRKIEEAKKAGVEVLTKPVEKYDFSSNPVAVLDVVCQDDPKGRTYRELLKGVKDAPAIVIGRDRQGDVVEAVKRDAVIAALAKKHTFARETIKEDKEHEKNAREWEKTHAISRKHQALVTAAVVDRVERRQPKASFLVALIVALSEFCDEIDEILVRRELATADELDEGARTEGNPYVNVGKVLAKVKDEATLRGIVAELVCVSSGVGREAMIAAYDVDAKALEKKARDELKKEAKS